MAQETKVEETRCSLQTFERNRYFYGKPMTVSDFEAEQRYLIGKQRYVNRLVHGAGVLCGLEVTVPTGFTVERPTVELAEGAALDCCGNLIIVSRSSTAEVKGDFDPEGLSYLYLKYAECSKSPVMLAANGSSCEEVCCYNRIQETFEVVASRTAPHGGEVTPPAAVPAKAKTKEAEPLPDPATVCRGLTEKYYQDNLKTCPGCDDPLVFLAVLDAGKGALDETETARYRSVVFSNSMLHELLCGHVTDYGNPHKTSAAQVLALQSVNGVGNADGRTFVGNIDLASKDKTIGVKGEVNDLKVDLSLAANSVKPSHLNAEVIEKLIQSNTISVEPHPGTKSITLNTTPAKSVTSVAGAQKVGVSSNFAPEDHVHDLSEGLVERRHLGADVYTSLVQGGGIIKVEGQAATRTIKISAEVAPGDDPKLVGSVTGTKRVGKSERYAREDHAHDLRINGRAPNESGQFVLTPGANVTIASGAADNELVISAAGDGKTTEIATGVFTFDNVLPQERRQSTLIAHRLDSGLVAIVLAQEESESLRSAEGVRLNPVNATAKFGDLIDFDDEAPALMAEVDFNQKTIQISLRDRRQGSRLDTGVKLTDEGGFTFAPTESATPRVETAGSGGKDTSNSFAPSAAIAPTGTGDDTVPDPNARTYKIRWWAIPA